MILNYLIIAYHYFFYVHRHLSDVQTIGGYAFYNTSPLKTLKTVTFGG
jgi:hypothetical protein